MSENKSKRKSWPQIGTIRKSDDGTSYIKLADGVELIVKGEKVLLNKSRTLKLQKPVDNVKQLQERGVIDSDEAERRLEKLEAMKWLTHEIVASPPKPE